MLLSSSIVFRWIFVISFSFCASLLWLFYDVFWSPFQNLLDFLGILYDLFLIHSEASIGVLKKMLLEVLKHPSIRISKILLMKILWKTTHFERFMSILDMQKKGCLRNSRHVQRFCACYNMLHMMKFGLVIYVFSFWLRNICDS